MSAINTHIDIRQNRRGQNRAFISGSRIRVQDIYVEAEVHGRNADEIVLVYPQLTLGQVHAALAYYFDNRDAIQDESREDRKLVEDARARTGPGPLEQKLAGAEATRDPLSS
jgi:uncharacterized protein (DUF433 family)